MSRPIPINNRKGLSRAAGRKASTLIVRIRGLSLLPASARRPRVLTRVCLNALSCRPVKSGLRPRGEVNVVFLSRRGMLALNKNYLQHDHDTDVIAFNYAPSPGENRDDPFGDVFISAFMARRQARELGHDVLREALTLAAHGCLHLIGYDDAAPRKKAAMFRLQERSITQ